MKLLVRRLSSLSVESYLHFGLGKAYASFILEYLVRQYLVWTGGWR